jgi:hypothetical protein
VIDAYLTALNAALRGPRRAKTDLLAEARDHLVDATENHERNGLNRTAAEQAAIDEFGELDEIVPGFQAELGLAQGHRTALAALTLTAAQPLVWNYTFPGAPGLPQLADDIVENIGGVAILLTLLAVLTYRWGMRHPTVRENLAQLTGVGALGVCAFLISASTLLTAWSSNHLALLWTVAFVLAPAAWVTTSARRCLLASRTQHAID